MRESHASLAESLVRAKLSHSIEGEPSLNQANAIHDMALVPGPVVLLFINIFGAILKGLPQKTLLRFLADGHRDFV